MTLSRRSCAFALAFAVALVASACGTTAASGCGSLETSGPPQPSPLRVLRLDQRWTAGTASYCVAGIRVYDGSFEIVGYESANWTWSDPWSAAFRGMSLGQLSDERGRMFMPSRSYGLRAGGAHVEAYDGPFGAGPKAQGDVLAGVRELRFTVRNALDAVAGPWRFEKIAVRTGPLSARATAAGRELRLYDLVVNAADFSVGYLPLGQVTPGTVVVTDDLAVGDDRGGHYAAGTHERIGTSAILYQRISPAPPAGAVLTIEIPRIYVSTDRTWTGTLTLP